MSFELPHKEDFATNTKLPGYLTENAEAIEQEDQRDDAALEELSNKVDLLNSQLNHFEEVMDKNGIKDY